MAKKVFLSHSSKNKEFIDSIFAELPPIAIYDKYSFKTGEGFNSAITAFLEDETSVFVLFASAESMNANWVEFEIEKAVELRIQGRINDVICIIIDDTSIDNIPKCLRSNNIYRSNNPKDISLEIITYLENNDSRSLLYFGRNNDLGQAENLLFPYPPRKESPTIFNIYGLPGIGRHTFFRRGILDILKHKYSKITFIEIEDGETVSSLAIKILSFTKKYSCYEEFLDISNDIKNKKEDEITMEVSKDIPVLLTQKTLLCFSSFENVLDDYGSVKSNFESFIKGICNKLLIFGTISRRKPFWKELSDTPILKLEGIDERAMTRLVSEYANQKNIALKDVEVLELVECASGHAGIAKQLVDLVKDYGVEIILKDKTRIAAYSDSIFSDHLSDVITTEETQTIINILNWFSPTPLFVFVELFKDTDCYAEISSLVDKCLVVVEPESNLISIAPPVANTIARHSSFPSQEIMMRIAEIIKKKYNETERFEAYQALAAARIMGVLQFSFPQDKTIQRMSILFDSDIVKEIKQLYYNDEYAKVISLSTKLIQQANPTPTILNILARSFMANNQFDEARLFIEKTESNGWLSPKNICMLRGLLFERQNKLDDALTQFNKAKLFSPRDLYVNMELAACYISRHEYLQAAKIIDLVYKNPDLRNKGKWLDYTIKVYTRIGKLSEAKELLDLRAQYSKDKYYYIRLSDWYRANDNIDAAIEAANMAEGKKYISKYMQLANLFFLKQDIPSFKDNLAYIQDTFPHKASYEISILQSELLILEHNYVQAFVLIKDNNNISPVIKNQVMYCCLAKMENLPSIPYSQRKNYKTMRQNLEKFYSDRLSLLQSIYYDLF